MSLSAAITFDQTSGKPVLTVTSDPRGFTVTVSAASATAKASGVWPLGLADSTGHAWRLRTDDGTTAVYDY